MTEFKPLTICRISPFFYPDCCGAAINSTEISRRLVEGGHTVYALTYIPRDVSRPLKEEKIFGVNVIRLKTKKRVLDYFDSIKPLTFKFNRIIEHLMHFLKIFKIVKKSDVILLHGYNSLTFLGAIAAKVHKKPYILKIIGSEVWRVIYKEVNLDRRFRFVLNNATYITSVSEYLERKAFEIGIKQNIIVIPNGIDFKVFDYRLNQSKNDLRRKFMLDPFSIVILSVLGLYNNPKGLSVKQKITALSHVLKKHPNVKLLIIGDGPLKNYLQKFAKKLNVSEKVIFAGWIPHEQIPQCYALADIFLLTSPLEGLPTVVLEAMVMEKPVITTKTGGQKHFIENGLNGIFVNPNNSKAIAEKICFLIEDEDRRKKIGQAARKTTGKKFDWERIINTLIKIVCSSLRESC